MYSAYKTIADFDVAFKYHKNCVWEVATCKTELDFHKELRPEAVAISSPSQAAAENVYGISTITWHSLDEYWSLKEMSYKLAACYKIETGICLFGQSHLIDFRSDVKVIIAQLKPYTARTLRLSTKDSDTFVQFMK